MRIKWLYGIVGLVMHHDGSVLGMFRFWTLQINLAVVYDVMLANLLRIRDQCTQLILRKEVLFHLI